MAEKLTKYEKKLKSQGASEARRSAKAQGRSVRAMGFGAGLLAAKLDASGMLSMTVPLPVIGDQPVAKVAGVGLMLAPLLMKNPGKMAQAGGYAGLALVARTMK